MTATDMGYGSGLLLENGALTSDSEVDAPNPYADINRRYLGSPNPTAAKSLLWTDVPFQLRCLVRGGDFLYFSWTTGEQYPEEGIYRMPYAGGTPLRLSDWRPVGFHSMVLDAPAGALYFFSDSPDHYGLASLDIAGATAPVLFRPEQRLATAVTVQGGRVYWADIDPGNAGPSKESWIRSIRPDGTDEKVVADLPTQIDDLISDEHALYFITTDVDLTKTPDVTMNLSSISLAGGNSTRVVAGESNIDLLTADADYLFYIGHGGVYRVRKPVP